MNTPLHPSGPVNDNNENSETRLRPIIMVIVEIENGLYDTMYRPALESVEKETKISLATRNKSKMGFHFRSEYVGSGKIEKSADARC